MRVCLDNNILIWGIRRICTPGQEDMISRTDALLDEIEDKKFQIMIPTVVLAEFLTYIPQSDHNNVVNTFYERFEIYPFDAQAGVVAARIWRNFATGNPSQKDQIRQAVPDITRVRIKADAMILATAIARDVDILYTHDKALTIMAEGRMTVKGLPAPAARQGDLLEE